VSVVFLRRYVVKGGDNDIKAALTAAMASFATVSSPGASTADDAGSISRTGKHVRDISLIACCGGSPSLQGK